MNRTATEYMKGLAAIAAAIFVLCLPAAIHAQEVRGRITGQVVDPTKAAVPGAVVTVTQVERATNITLTTNSDGFFVAPYLITGTYRVTVEKPGFKKAALVLKGVKPGDIPWGPVEKFSLVVNQGAARLQGVRIADDLRKRADKVLD